ncbi:hypothetical protein LTR91_014338 [Friedmanniomyces endolithicus]|uniref:Uncharacterized protein n=1 Tax=Friedmanniomyces endolithicus TaxID=329885 RepID=A0AAN6KC34_9PEZI|nr:hypothetical protein LTR57_012590 [Friedmanniomyces endolithicus]KAK0974495.1 hypothetical protein LTR91_014338 [Friedmanniomyces endolithicus]KAK1035626.1 hypothetical protein LTS16_014448 [Friedmanniomyces endolithicus]
MAPSSEQDAEEALPLELIVFSCGVCQAVLPELYATKENNKGFHSDSGGENGVVSKLWIAECSHIMCGKHLPGGAAPFHPKGEQPRAPCLQCQERGDHSLKDLYGIRGLDKSEMDTVIPPEWMQCPAIKLDGTVPGMEAVRFQYMNVARYAQRVTKYWKRSERQRNVTETAYSKEHKQRRKLQDENFGLKARIQALEVAEVKLHKWEARKPVINHYLQAVNDMSRSVYSSARPLLSADTASDIAVMRSRLLQLGYDVPKRSYAFASNNAAQSSVSAANDRPLKQGHNVPAAHNTSSSTRKRKLTEYAPELPEHVTTHISQPRSNSRELMPPPLPRPRQRPERIAAAPPHPVSKPFGHARDEYTWQREAAGGRDENALYSPPRLNPQALPFRSSRSNSMHQQHHYHHNAPCPRSSAPSRQGQYNIVNGHHDPPQQLTYQEREGLLTFPLHHPETRDTHQNAGYGFVAQRLESPAQTPQLLYSANQIDQELSTGLGNQLGINPPQMRRGLPIAPVASPFFERGAAFGSPAEGLPTGGRHTQSQYRIQDENNRTNPSYDYAQVYSQRPSLTGSTFADRLRQTVDHQAPYQMRPYQAATVLTRSGEVRDVPQTPRNLQGLFQRPDLPQLPASYAHSMSQANAHRGRVSLPLSRQTVGPAKGSQEKALSQIRGVKGASSAGVRTGPNQSGPLYDAPRTLFSSAGGRRSVRR